MVIAYNNNGRDFNMAKSNGEIKKPERVDKPRLQKIECGCGYLKRLLVMKGSETFCPRCRKWVKAD